MKYPGCEDWALCTSKVTMSVGKIYLYIHTLSVAAFSGLEKLSETSGGTAVAECGLRTLIYDLVKWTHQVISRGDHDRTVAKTLIQLLRST